MSVNVPTNLNAPINGGYAITPNDTTILSPMTRQIQATTAGNIAIVFADATTLTVPFAAGEVRSMRAQQVLATGTTATGILGFY